ncbi:hypothetical protein [uncultured Bacteroides sp.]|uniref:hypothetical protein n=1 Tax=uncultured Bacteroides sp. TaxID=162156 RepID=UPI0025964A8B|nr:hypothetical protein [uncultured Bacteroides sp.]
MTSILFSNKRYYYLLLAFCSIAFVILFAYVNSPLYVRRGIDQMIFQQIGYAILEGKVPYIDVFDHKGFYLFLFQAIGLFIGGGTGILLLQAISLFLTLIMFDEIIRLFQKNPATRFCFILLSLSILLCLYQGGGTSEDISLPFITFPWMLYLKRIKSKSKITNLETIAIGLCFGILSFIRISNAAPFCGLFIFIFIDWFIQKQYKTILVFICFLILGILIAITPCLIYFHAKAGMEGVNQMLYGTFFFNMEYIQSTKSGLFSIRALNFICIVSLFVILLLKYNHDKSKVMIPTLLGYFFSFAAIGTRYHLHYMMIFLPLFIISLSQIPLKKSRFNLVIATIFSFFFLINAAEPLARLIQHGILQKDSNKEVFQQFHNFASTLSQTDKDSIYNYNGSVFALSLLNQEAIVQCNRIIMRSHLTISKKLKIEEENKKLKAMNPKYILICLDEHTSIKDIDMDYINEHYKPIEKFKYKINLTCFKRIKK